MVTEILVVLISIALVSLGGMQQSEADYIVSGFVPAIFAVIHHCYAVALAAVSKVSPAL